MRLDPAALRQGASVALVFAVPFSIASRWLADRDSSSPWVSVLWLAALAGFALGAGIAAWTQQKGLPLLHGLLCAGGTYLAAQSAFVVVKALRGGEIRWIAILFTFSVVLVAGVIGGALGSLLQRQGFTPSHTSSTRKEGTR